MSATVTGTGTEIATRIGFTPTMPSLGNWPTNGDKFIVDEELKEYGKFLVKKYRADLVGMNIAYVFKQKASKNGDITINGTAKIESDLQKVLHGLDALIIIGWDEWCAMDVDNKLRIMFTEIEKIVWDEKSGKLKTRLPEVSTFPSVVKVFGPSSQSEIEYIAAYNQFIKDNGGI